MPGVSKEQIAKAREIDLLSYLQAYEPGAVKKVSANEYCLVEHDSLKISNGKWNWHSRGIGGRNALKFLIEVRGMEFVDAVRALCGDTVIFSNSAPPVKSSTNTCKTRPVFALPPPNSNNFRVIAYLQNRGIDREVIDRCIDEGTLYENKEHSCVFVGKDSTNTPRFACVRSTLNSFKGDVRGSDKRFGFTAPVKTHRSRGLFVFESPIDALSLATIDKQALDGLSWDSFERLSLGGVSDLALMQYLKDHPDTDCICLCLDNDKTGLDAARKIDEKLMNMQHPKLGCYKLSDMPPAIGKDYNELLLEMKHRQRDERIKNHKKSDISI